MFDQTKPSSIRRLIGVAMVMLIALASAACGGGDGPIRVISPDDANAMLFENPPEDLVVLDVRTFEEFQQARLPEAVMIDYYQPDFAAQLAQLDRDVPYLLYCRTGNRSGETRAIMEDLGFTNVSDIDGGIADWLDQGHPFVQG